MKPNTNNEIVWSDDSGDEGLGRVKGVDRGYSGLYGGHTDVTKFYIPETGQRLATSTEGRNQGDHVIAYNLILNHLLFLKGQNIKTLPDTILKVVEAIFPGDKEQELKDRLNQLKEQIINRRATRKTTTAALRQSGAEILEQTKPLLIEGEQRHIQIAIENIVGDFVATCNGMDNESHPKARKHESPMKPNQKSAGTEKGALNHLIAINEFLALHLTLGEEKKIADRFLTNTSKSGNARGSDLRHFFKVRDKYRNDNQSDRKILLTELNKYPGNKDGVLTHIGECVFDLYDYPRTGKLDAKLKPKDKDDYKFDDEQVLFVTIPKLVILVFTTFPELQKLPVKDKEKIYDDLLNKILQDQCWEGHQVIIDGEEVGLNLENLKTAINQFAEMDFANNKFSMRDLGQDFVFEYSEQTKRETSDDESPSQTQSSKSSAESDLEGETPIKPVNLSKKFDATQDQSVTPSKSISPRKSSSKSEEGIPTKQFSLLGLDNKKDGSRK